VPCCENPLAWVTGAEADQYRAFVDDYSKFWQKCFDPIALRIQATPKRYRVETLVLPLIDNPIYTAVAQALGGKAEPLDALPVPKRNIFSSVVRLNKETLLKVYAKEFDDFLEELQEAAKGLNVPLKDLKKADVKEVLTKGLGSQVGLHVYDAPSMFDFDLCYYFGLMLGRMGGLLEGPDDYIIMAFLAASMNAPTYLSMTVQDAGVVDRFLEKLDRILAVVARVREKEAPGIDFEMDFYKTKLKPDTLMRAFGFRFGPIKWRFFWARIGGGLYIASKPFILRDLMAAEAARGQRGAAVAADTDATGHAMVRLRPEHWQRVLADDRLNWAENSRQACVRNLGPLSSVARAVMAKRGAKLGPAARLRETLDQASRVYGVHFFCPEGGRYEVSADGKHCACSLHGSALDPRQELEPNEDRGPQKLAERLRTVTATLTFLEDGLHAVLVVERR
jgi:hypothetical protein